MKVDCKLMVQCELLHLITRLTSSPPVHRLSFFMYVHISSNLLVSIDIDIIRWVIIKHYQIIIKHSQMGGPYPWRTHLIIRWSDQIGNNQKQWTFSDGWAVSLERGLTVHESLTAHSSPQLCRAEKYIRNYVLFQTVWTWSGCGVMTNLTMISLTVLCCPIIISLVSHTKTYGLFECWKPLFWLIVNTWFHVKNCSWGEISGCVWVFQVTASQRFVLAA